MVFAGLVQTAQFQAGTVRLKRGVDPSIGTPFLEQIRYWRKIDQAQTTFIVRNLPAMRVAKKIGFDLAAWAQDFEQFDGVLQRAGAQSGIERS